MSKQLNILFQVAQQSQVALPSNNPPLSPLSSGYASPKQFADEEVFGTYNTACTFIKHMKYDKAELNEVEDVLKKPTRQCDVCKAATTKA
jgi:hypothetical protein